MLEKECLLRCRREDEQMIEKLLPECLDELQKVWGDKTKVTIDKNYYLPEDNAGGIELSSKGGKIQVISTLESRLDLIAGQVSILILSMHFC
jgi:vacuolar-type H+-ATPase subunit E/Vma4